MEKNTDAEKNSSEPGRKYIPEEVITNILLRLPFSSLRTFQGVCKTWQSIITSDHFKKIYFKLDYIHGTPQILLIKALSGTISILDTKTWQEKDTIDIPLGGFAHLSGCCNGVVCLSSFSDNYDEGALLLNPLTRETLLVPPPAEAPEFYKIYCSYYLGFDNSMKKFKVLCQKTTVYSDESEDFILQVYTVGEGEPSWRSIPYSGYEIPSENIVCWNGSLYWLATDESKKSVCSFDFKDEKIMFFDREDVQFLRAKGKQELKDLKGSSDWLLAFSENETEVIKRKRRNFMDLWTIGGKDDKLKRFKYFTDLPCKSPRAMLVHDQKIIVCDGHQNALGCMDLVDNVYLSRFSCTDISDCCVYVESIVSLK